MILLGSLGRPGLRMVQQVLFKNDLLFCLRANILPFKHVNPNPIGDLESICLVEAPELVL